MRYTNIYLFIHTFINREYTPLTGDVGWKWVVTRQFVQSQNLSQLVYISSHHAFKAPERVIKNVCSAAVT